MELDFLKRFEGKRARILLKNNHIYENVVFSISSEGLIVFDDNVTGERLYLEPKLISLVGEESLKKQEARERLELRRLEYQNKLKEKSMPLDSKKEVKR